MPEEGQFSSKTPLIAEEESPARVSFLDRVTPKFVREARVIFREQGAKAVVRRFGWKLFAAFFIYYLIRDSFLYILLPYLITKGLLGS